MSELTAEIYEKYADLEDELFPEPRGGSGGKKKKSDPRDPRSVTAKAIKSGIVEASQEKRKEAARNNLERVFKEFPSFEVEQKKEDFLEMYALWVNVSLEAGFPYIDQKDLDEEFMRSGKKAGGQNVNKVSSAVRLKHIPTNITVRNEETRDQAKNRQFAKEGLEDLLKEHLKDWKTYLGENKTEIDKNTVAEIMRTGK